MGNQMVRVERSDIKVVKSLSHKGIKPKGDSLYALALTYEGETYVLYPKAEEYKKCAKPADKIEYDFWKDPKWLEKENEAALGYDSKGELPGTPRSRVDEKNRVIGFMYEYAHFGYFSNWFPAPFKIKDVQYKNTEDYYMQTKVRLFCDEAQITAPNCRDRAAYAKNLPPVTERPGAHLDWFEYCMDQMKQEVEDIEDGQLTRLAVKYNKMLLGLLEKGGTEALNNTLAKHIGRSIAGFNNEKWGELLPEVTKEMRKANLEKFTQNPDLRQLLLKTEDYHLCEAARFDDIWGIGISVDGRSNFPKAGDDAQEGGIFEADGMKGTAVNIDWTTEYPIWRGQNLLGKVLMQVREEISSGAEVAEKLASLSPAVAENLALLEYNDITEDPNFKVRNYSDPNIQRKGIFNVKSGKWQGHATDFYYRHLDRDGGIVLRKGTLKDGSWEGLVVDYYLNHEDEKTFVAKEKLFSGGQFFSDVYPNLL